MATIKGNPVDTTLYPVVTKAFQFDEVTVPPRYEVELLGAEVTRTTVRYRKGQRVACKTWRDFEDLREKAKTYGGEVLFVWVHVRGDRGGQNIAPPVPDLSQADRPTVSPV